MILALSISLCSIFSYVIGEGENNILHDTVHVLYVIVLAFVICTKPQLYSVVNSFWKCACMPWRARIYSVHDDSRTNFLD